MNGILTPEGFSEYEKLVFALRAGKSPAALSSLQNVQKAHAAAMLVENLKKSALIVAPDEAQAERLALDLSFFLGESRVLFFPQKDLNFSIVDVKSLEWENRRAAALYQIAAGGNFAVVTTIEAAMQTVPGRKGLFALTRVIRDTDEIDAAELLSFLAGAGYVPSEKAEGPGQYARRGGIFDIFSPGYEKPVRLDLFGDEIDSITFFDVLTQRRGEERLREFLILPARETVFSKKEEKIICEELETELAKGEKKPLLHDLERLKAGIPIANAEKYVSLLPGERRSLFSEYLPGALLLFTDYFSSRQSAKGYFEQSGEDFLSAKENGFLPSSARLFLFSFDELLQEMSEKPLVLLDTLPRDYPEFRVKMALSLPTKPTNPFQGGLELFSSEVLEYKQKGFAQIVACAGAERAERIRSRLAGEGIFAAVSDALRRPEPGEVLIFPRALSSGGEYTNEKLAFFAEGDFARRARPRRRAGKDAGEKIKAYTDLKTGDYIVHIHHGIGRFDGIHSLEVEGVTRDYLKIRYKGTDVLYVPCDQLETISKYMGAEAGRVPLAKLGGSEWAKTKSRVRAAVRDMAKELLALYSARANKEGFSFSPDGDLQRDFESRFEYEETEDQLRSAAEIKGDMEKKTPMDRLLCGDVGFGKTEVALRAVMKCVGDSKQAAILVPTTVLAEQHYQTILSRFEGFPVGIEVLSSARSAAKQKEIIKRLKAGAIDIIVGTHSLLSQRVQFKDLGLLVVDEEQRFGVKQKERIKEMAVGVDILTLSATPIPRTLNMALGGIRDMSVIEEAPKDRLPVQTYVLEQSPAVALDAIKKELARGGQVYYLHNRIEDLDRVVRNLAQELPAARIVCGHGKMNEKELFAAVGAMVRGEADILVCTTIIESGIDIPNVNTILVDDADHLGLAQLHQIRGRVGRSSRRAYAYFTYRRGKVLSEEAAKRLSAIREFAEFGAGFKIALRDLEIRGAGNLLGSEQHGHIESVGYELYQRLLADAVRMEKSGEREEKKETACLLDLKVNAYIPASYIRSYEERIDAYKKIAEIEDEKDEFGVKDELFDRYGDIPEVTLALIELSRIKNRAKEFFVTEITQKEGMLFLYFEKESTGLFVRMLPEGKSDLSLDFSTRARLCVCLREGANVAKVLKNVLDRLQETQKLI